MGDSIVDRVRYALEQVENGSPLKDFMDHEDVLDALGYLVRLADEEV
ncbi:hypothetical protein N9937_00355 [bacterium]|nr:hypothetical protein [bacterium]